MFHHVPSKGGYDLLGIHLEPVFLAMVPTSTFCKKKKREEGGEGEVFRYGCVTGVFLGMGVF